MRGAGAAELAGGVPARAARGAPATLVGALALALAALGAGHAALLWGLEGLPYQDVPNHLARAVISADLLFDGGRRFGAAFSLHPGFTPYVLPDLLFAALVEALGPYAGARAFTILLALSMPAAVAVSLRALRLSTYAVLLGAILALYLGTDWSFVMGFQAFRLSVALTLLALAAWQVFLRSGSARSLAAYAICLALGYLTHLSALHFVGIGAPVIAALALRARTTTLPRALAGAVPLLVLGAVHVATSGVAPPGATAWETPAEKLRGLFSPFRRSRLGVDAPLVALLAATVAALARAGRRAWRTEAARGAAALAAVFLALYLAMPVGRGGIWYIDVRALPFVAVFAVAAALAAADAAGRPSAAAAALAIALGAANLGVLWARLAPADAESRAYRAIAARVPEGAAVLPVDTRPRTSSFDPLLHAGLFATVERGARTPYLWTSGVTPHFLRRGPPLPAPWESWYVRGEPVSDPAAIARAYDFLLVTRPYDAARLPARTRLVEENATAALTGSHSRRRFATPAGAISHAVMVRQPAVAGSFYTGRAPALAAEVDAFLADAPAPRAPAIGLVAPHAGYVYSGAVAGAVYGRVDVPARVIVLGPNHTGKGHARAALSTAAAWRTPLGEVPIDPGLTRALAALPGVAADPDAHAREHALEVQVPFLQRARPDVSIAALCLAHLSYEACEALGLAIADVAAEAGALVVASSDMSHYISAEEARAADGRAIDRILALDPQGLYEVVHAEAISMCGIIPATVMLVAARARGARTAELVRFANSGDVSGDFRQVVGYAGIVVA
jgi:AmmeMemoRadiSam system protein B